MNRHSRRIHLLEVLEVGIQSLGHMAVHCMALGFVHTVLLVPGMDSTTGLVGEVLALSTAVVDYRIAAAAVGRHIHLAQAERHSALGTRLEPETDIPCSAGALAGAAQGMVRMMQEARQHHLLLGVKREAFVCCSKVSAQ